MKKVSKVSQCEKRAQTLIHQHVLEPHLPKMKPSHTSAHIIKTQQMLQTKSKKMKMYADFKEINGKMRRRKGIEKHQKCWYKTK